jgi:hypothetical protein
MRRDFFPLFSHWLGTDRTAQCAAAVAVTCLNRLTVSDCWSPKVFKTRDVAAVSSIRLQSDLSFCQLPGDVNEPHASSWASAPPAPHSAPRFSSVHRAHVRTTYLSSIVVLTRSMLIALQLYRGRPWRYRNASLLNNGNLINSVKIVTEIPVRVASLSSALHDLGWGCECHCSSSRSPVSAVSCVAADRSVCVHSVCKKTN